MFFLSLFLLAYLKNVEVYVPTQLIRNKIAIGLGLRCKITSQSISYDNEIKIGITYHFMAQLTNSHWHRSGGSIGYNPLASEVHNYAKL